MTPPHPHGKHRSTNRILLGLIVGTLIGAAFNLWGPHPARDWILANVVQPTGQLFLRGLFMVVVPLVFSSLAVGVAGLGSAENIARLGWRLIAFYVATTLIAILIGQTLVSAFVPGGGVPAAFIEQAKVGFAGQVADLAEKSRLAPQSLWPGILYSIVPKNIPAALAEGQMLSVIFVSILLGVALLAVQKEKSGVAIRFLGALSDACIVMVGWIMKLAPYAVAALMIGAVASFGLAVMANVLKYMGIVFLGYLLHFFGVFPILVRALARIPVSEFFRRGMPVFVTSFSTSSSNATIPTTIETLEKRFGVPEEITAFSIPLGATVNMNGTALFEVVAALFVAQVFGVHVGLAGQVSLVILVLFSAIGVAGVPGGSIPLLMSAMAAVGIPPEGIALVLGVDRLLDMGRTVLNVTGDMVGALYLARKEGKLALPREYD